MPKDTATPADATSVVQQVYAAFGAGDGAAIVDLAAADAAFEVVGRPADYPVFGPRRGPEGVAAFLTAVAENEDIRRFEVRELHAAGEVVLALGHAAYVLRASGRPVESDFAHVWRVRDGRIAAFRGFYDTAAIVEAYSAR